MAKPGATPIVRPPAGTEPAAAVTAATPQPASGTGRPGDDALVAMFNQVRDELVSTLLYLLGNADDAQDAAQEAFLKCWRAGHTVPDVQNLRAWIFRVGLNAAKDFQRSAWNRKSRPLPEDDVMMPGRDDAPGQSLEDQEALDRLAPGDHPAAPGRKGSVPAAAERRTDLRADRRDPERPGRHREDPDADRPHQAPQGAEPRRGE